MKTTATSAKQVASLGILAGLALCLSLLESWLPPLPIPGAKWGLSNLATLTALSLMGTPAGLAIAAIKGIFALLRGGTACLMSLSGGLASTLLTAGLLRFGRDRLGWLGIGMAGAAAHNTGQLLCAMWLVDIPLWRTAPLLLLFALPAGCLTGLVMHILLPKLTTLHRDK